MKKLIVASVFCIGFAQLGTGCFVTSSNRDGEVEPERFVNQFLVRWDLVSGDANAPVDCPLDVNVAQVVSLDELGEQFVDEFSCIDGAGTTMELPEGEYDVYINLFDDDNNLVAQSPLIERNALGFDEPGLVELIVEFSIDRGAFELSWEIEANGNSVACANTEANGIGIESTLVADTNEVQNDRLECSAGTGITRGLPVGNYDLSLTMRSGDTPIGEALTRNADIEHGNHINLLDPFVFDITPVAEP